MAEASMALQAAGCAPAAARFDALRGDVTATVAALLRELDGLGRIVAETRTQIAALRADRPDAMIPVATDELAEVVEHTAKATHEILDTCETLEAFAASQPEGSDALQAATTRIYEACAFQDITGQRIAKVVSALQQIEARISRAREVMGVDDAGAEDAVPHAPSSSPDALHGPQMPGAGISQSDIDALFD